MGKVPKYDKIHNRFRLNNQEFSTQKDLAELAYTWIKEGTNFEKQIGVFLQDWLDNKPFIEVQTSGSTGSPKRIKLQKQAMVQSAIHTGNYFKLTAGDTALLCLPATYIAGKMMLVRAIILGLRLESIEPKNDLKIPTDKLFAFSAMTPTQLSNAITKLNLFRTIIVGGAPISQTLKEAIYPIQPLIFETYGMTETASHIAVKPIVHKTSLDRFTILPDIEISQDERDCLVISAPYISKKPIVTNDVVKLHGKDEFEWLGRYDNVINTGGVKVFPEQIEAKLKASIPNRFFITAIESQEWGEAVTLVVESEEHKALSDFDFSMLTAYEKPKHILSTSKFSETKSGKLNRNKTLEILKTKQN